MSEFYDDPIIGTNSADTLHGLSGNDIINSGAGDDLLFGGEGDDELHAGSGEDTLHGGTGNDHLVGGGHSDTFVFDFNMLLGQLQTHTFGLTPQDFDTNGNGVSQNEFAHFQTAYRAWLAGFGTDLNGDGVVNVNYNFNNANPLTGIEGLDPSAVGGAVSSITIGAQTRFWEQSITVGAATTVTSNDGHDTVAGYNADQDQLELRGLAGISLADFDRLFDFTEFDSNNDGTMDGTVFRLADESWSVTLNGLTGAHINYFYGFIA